MGGVRSSFQHSTVPLEESERAVRRHRGLALRLADLARGYPEAERRADLVRAARVVLDRARSDCDGLGGTDCARRLLASVRDTERRLHSSFGPSFESEATDHREVESAVARALERLEGRAGE